MAGTSHPFGTEMLLLYAAVLAAPLVLRTRFPATAWAASVVSLIWVSAGDRPAHPVSAPDYPIAGVLVYGLCLYAVGVRGKGWFVLCVAAVTVLGAIVVDAQTAAVAILAAIPLLMGAIVRARRSSRTELAQQARRLEGERALLTERQRIARELHDIVAHHMSVIAIQAEAAPRKVANPPPELAESFADIRASALSGLDELRRRPRRAAQQRRGHRAPARSRGTGRPAGLRAQRRRADNVVGQRHGPGPAAGRRPVRLPDPAGGAE